MSVTSRNIKLIIKQCCTQNPIAQKKLFEINYSLVYSICRRYGKSPEIVKEMLNDTFYRCFKKIDKYDPQFPFEPWLKKLCINCCLRHIEKYREKITFDSNYWYEKNNNENLNFNLPTIEDLNYLKLIDNLPEACKLVINLYVIEEYKHHEIAEILNISVGTSKSNLHRAKKLLYEMLEKDGRNKLKLKSDYGR